MNTPAPQPTAHASVKPHWIAVPHLSIALCLIAVLAVVLNNHQTLAGTILLKGAVVHTVSGPTLTNGSVLIANHTIEQVGLTINRTADLVVDLKGQHLYPGLIAASTDLGLTEISAVRSTRDAVEVGNYTPDVQSWIAVNPDSELIAVARANGITQVHPVPQGGVVSGQSGLVALDGWTAEQMTIQRPVALHVFWPSLQLDTRPKNQLRDQSKYKSLDDQAKSRTRKLKDLDEFFLEARAYAQARKSADPQQLANRSTPAWEAMLPWTDGDQPLMIHANEYRQIKSALQWATSRKFQMILAGGRDAWRLADELASNNIPVVYEEIYDLPPRDEDLESVQLEAPAKLHRAGVKVSFALGGRYTASTLRNLPYAAAQAVAHGLPEEEAIKGLTLHPAQTLGVADRLGSIEPGKQATLIAVSGNILDLRANVKHMWISGKPVSLESRHTRLYNKYRQRPKTR